MARSPPSRAPSSSCRPETCLITTPLPIRAWCCKAAVFFSPWLSRRWRPLRRSSRRRLRGRRARLAHVANRSQSKLCLGARRRARAARCVPRPRASSRPRGAAEVVERGAVDFADDPGIGPGRRGTSGSTPPSTPQVARGADALARPLQVSIVYNRILASLVEVHRSGGHASQPESWNKDPSPKMLEVTPPRTPPHRG